MLSDSFTGFARIYNACILMLLAFNERVNAARVGAKHLTETCQRPVR